MITLSFQINANLEQVYVSAFEVDNKRRICFGAAAHSKNEINLSDLEDNYHEFIDYVMEGFVRYQLRLRRSGQKTILDIRLPKKNTREKAMGSLVQMYIKSSGLKFEI